ncbi:MAG: ATP synthase F1 subunit delta [Planctomycetaceae bacterium]|nr:ATP synthase F1 subunit delta [Planctomycetaceae bacterium]
MPESNDITARDARTVAQMEADVGAEHIATVYAKGFLGAAEEAGETAAVMEEFDAVIADVVGHFPKLKAVLDSGLVLPEEKETLIERLFAGRVSPTLVNFLKVVARHGRLDCLATIHHEARVLHDRMRNRIPVTLTTATPPTPEMVQRIVEALRAKLGGEPILDQRVDPDLIGGAVIRVGDTIYDGSIANQLQNLRQHIQQSTAHEIQSRRDRFRHSAGN